ncbi:hypothetical protein HX99_04195 [Peptococcaceae bacterium SCADC1_2_3]|nr:hypothetical protein HX99_04195 [Peptococcaceae bacterium SCADC1_2_3]KFI37359.1 hypothetical protein HY02_07880 [Peptococcaceae bacterium SCADC1_2_3]
MVISKVYNWKFISENLTKTIIRGEKAMIIDLHVHTKVYSSCSIIGPAEAIREAKKNWPGRFVLYRAQQKVG